MTLSKASEDLRLLLRLIVVSIVGDEEAVCIEVKETPIAIVLTILTNQKEVGRLIGVKGRTAKAIKNVLSGASTKIGRRFEMQILN